MCILKYVVKNVLSIEKAIRDIVINELRGRIFTRPHNKYYPVFIYLNQAFSCTIYHSSHSIIVSIILSRYHETKQL